MTPEETNDIKIARMDEKVKTILDILQDIRQHYITKEEFDPVKKVVYGLVALVLISATSGIIALVIGG